MKFINTTLLIALLLTGLAGSNLSAQSINQEKELFHKAQSSFSQAQQLTGNEKRLAMLKAASQFETLAKEYGIQNGYLFYNIGNAFYEAGEKGKAILYYRRAERLLPGFSDLKFNLNTVQQDLNVPEPKTTWWDEIIKSILFWHYMFDYSSRRLAALIGFIGFWLSLIILIFYKSPLIKATAILAAVFTIAIGGSFLLSAYHLNSPSTGVVIQNHSQVRKGPGNSYEPVYEQPLSEGTEFNLMEVQGNWWKVRLVNHDEVWINSAAVELI